jgi:hypothetical protein
VYATQTFQLRRSRLAERGKPLIRHLTTIEFGRVTYEDDFRACLAAAGVELTELHTMRATRYLAHRLAVARPALPPVQDRAVQDRARNASITGASTSASVTRAR